MESLQKQDFDVHKPREDTEIEGEHAGFHL